MNWDVIQWATGIFIAAVAAGWTIITLKHRSDEKIVELKDEKTRDIIRDVDELTRKLDNLHQSYRIDTQNFAVIVKEIQGKFELLNERIASNSSNSERVTDALKDFVRSTENRFKNIEHAMSNLELVRIGKTDRYIVKNLRRDSVD